MKLNLTAETPEVAAAATSSVPPAFPSVRYFQIHFEQLEREIAEVRALLATLRQDLVSHDSGGMNGFSDPAPGSRATRAGNGRSNG